MNQINIFQAKTDLSKLIAAQENHKEDQIIIARGGKPVAVLTAYESLPKKRIIGKFNGKYKRPENIDESNDEILKMFGDGDAYLD